MVVSDLSRSYTEFLGKVFEMETFFFLIYSTYHSRWTEEEMEEEMEEEVNILRRISSSKWKRKSMAEKNIPVSLITFQK